MSAESVMEPFLSFDESSFQTISEGNKLYARPVLTRHYFYQPYRDRR